MMRIAGMVQVLYRCWVNYACSGENGAVTEAGADLGCTWRQVGEKGVATPRDRLENIRSQGA